MYGVKLRNGIKLNLRNVRVIIISFFSFDMVWFVFI